MMARSPPKAKPVAKRGGTATVRGSVKPTKLAAKKAPAKKAVKKAVPKKVVKKAAPKKVVKKSAPAKEPEWNALKQFFSLSAVGGAQGNVRQPGGKAGFF